MRTLKVNLAYGQGHLPIELPAERTTIIEPAHTAGLADERAALVTPWKNRSVPLPMDLIKPHSRICITFTDITRATPNERIIPWLFATFSMFPGTDHTS